MIGMGDDGQERWHLRTWPDERHASTQDIEELGPFVDSACPQESTQTSDASIVADGNHATPWLGTHSAKFMDPEDVAASSQTLLTVQDRGAIAHEDETNNDERRQQQENRKSERQEDIACSRISHRA